jgi:hypothetical protein
MISTFMFLGSAGGKKMALFTSSFSLATCLAYSSTLMLEAVFSTETPITRRYVSEESTFRVTMVYLKLSRFSF